MTPGTAKCLPYLLLSFNTLWVLINYGLVKYTSWDKTPGFRTFKIAFLAMSLLLVICRIWGVRQKINWHLSGIYGLVLLFSGLSAGMVMLSDISVFWQYLTFSIPLLYTLLTLSLVVHRDGIRVAHERLIAAFHWVFLLPVLLYLLLERPFFSPYLSATTVFFKHNHYGWISVMFLVLSADVLQNNKLVAAYRWLTVALMPVAYYIFLASGNRATWVSGGISLAVLLFRSSLLSGRQKWALLAGAVLPTGYFAAQPHSSFYEAWERTDAQLTYGTLTSERLLWAKSAFTDLWQHPWQWLAGRGMFNYNGLINPHGYHNSYYEILFGCGIPVFLLFAYAMVWKPLMHYWKGYSTRFLTFFPLLIIPFFESNLTGGQFLFYPWFSFMIFYYLSPSRSTEEADKPLQ